MKLNPWRFRQRRGLSILSRVILFLLLPVMVIGTLLGGIFLNQVEQMIESRLQEDVEIIARALRKPVSYAYERGGEGMMQESLESVLDLGRVYSAFLYDLNRQIVAQAGEVRRTPRYPTIDPPITTDEDGHIEGEGSYERSTGEVLYSHYVPVLSQSGLPLGILQVSRQRSDILEHLEHAKTRFLWIYSGMMLFLGGIIVGGYHLSFGYRIRLMKGTINRVAAGHLDARCEVKGPRELADLAEMLNEMLDSIEEAQREIAERRRSEARLKSRLDEARNLLFLGQMAGSLAHEIGAPLATIDGKAQQGLRHHENPQRAQRYFQGIRDEVRDIEVFIRQLLSFGQQSMEPGETTSLARLVSESWQQACDALNENNRPLRLDTDAPDLMVRVNAFRMGLALKNLFQNALQSGPETIVRASWKNSDIGWDLSIEDTGPGIEPARRKDIFKPFISSHHSGRNLGLGLSLVKMVVLEHDGDIELSGSPEGGAAFLIRFPHQPGKPFEAVADIPGTTF